MMAVATGTSFILASISWILVFSGMQMFKPFFSSSQFHTILGGYLGSLLFILLLTSVGNLESIVFGKSFQIKLFPEVSSCLLIAILASSTIHRVCGTSWIDIEPDKSNLIKAEHCLCTDGSKTNKCVEAEIYGTKEDKALLKILDSTSLYFKHNILISLCALYYINKYSQKIYTVQASQPAVQTGKKKKHI